jgi:ATP-dependent DNA helicase RecQ
VAEMQRRKKRDLEKVAAVVSFVEEDRRCRQQFLQEYFNEYTENTCGICDNCLQHKKRDVPIPIEVYTKYRQKILEILPAAINQVVDYQFFNNKDFVKDIIRKMIENEEISFSELGILYSKRKGLRIRQAKIES